MRTILPFVIHTVLLALVLFNLAVARSEEGMDEKVLWSALGFAVVIVFTASCLYRSSDESPGVGTAECRSSRYGNGRRSGVKVGAEENASNAQWS